MKHFLREPRSVTVSWSHTYSSLFGIFVLPVTSIALQQYDVSNDLGFGRIFDGIGGLSGGGATSKLLINYKEPQRSQILDYLFKPKFGASLQILKVEIGGDDQTTDGTEASHMHEETEENYQRGYEWWLMKEAIKRNPNIKLYGLSWAWPHWLSNDKNQPYRDLEKTAMYTVKWILGAKMHHNLTIDYIGIWNERPCDLSYIVVLKRALVENKLDNVRIIGCDGVWDFLGPVLSNKTVLDSLYAYGVHYPGTTAPKMAIDSNMTLWSSEDYSTYNDEVGAGCWARILNQNYVNGYMTSTIAWNLIASYYFGLPYEGDGLMTAVEPWSGYYEVKSPVWITAHTTQFTEIGWRYLKHGHGVGLLEKGGSYVSLTSPNSKHLTIIIETMTRDHSVCIRPDLPHFDVSQQKAIFKLGGTYTSLKKLFIWYSKLSFDGTPSSMFQYNGSIEVINNRISLSLNLDCIYTLTTISDAKKGSAGPVPSSTPFMLPYEEDFQNYSLHEEPYNLAPQLGTWEVLKDNTLNLQYARQMVLSQPVSWCDQQPYPLAIIGSSKWTDLNITARIRWPDNNATDRIFVATQVNYTDCQFDTTATGFFFWVDRKLSSYTVTTDLIAMNILDAGLLGRSLQSNKWYTISLAIKNQTLKATVDYSTVVSSTLDPNQKRMKSGFAAIGSTGYGHSDISYLRLSRP